MIALATNAQGDRRSSSVRLELCLLSNGFCSYVEAIMLSNAVPHTRSSAGSMRCLSLHSKVVENCNLTVKAEQCTVQHLC